MLYTTNNKLPTRFHSLPVYLAGGSAGCPDWQSKLLGLIDQDGFDVVNPRRSKGLAKNSMEDRLQLEWEHRALQHANIVLFWFPKESECATAMFEYGKILERADTLGLRIIAGYDPEYAHAAYLELQTQLAVDWAENDDLAVDLVSGWEKFKELVFEEVGK